jgi:hypothetical protein
MKQLAKLLFRPMLAMVITMAFLASLGGCSLAQIYNINTWMNWAGTQLSGLGL